MHRNETSLTIYCPAEANVDVHADIRVEITIKKYKIGLQTFFARGAIVLIAIILGNKIKGFWWSYLSTP